LQQQQQQQRQVMHQQRHSENSQYRYFPRNRTGTDGSCKITARVGGVGSFSITAGGGGGGSSFSINDILDGRYGKKAASSSFIPQAHGGINTPSPACREGVSSGAVEQQSLQRIVRPWDDGSVQSGGSQNDESGEEGDDEVDIDVDDDVTDDVIDRRQRKRKTPPTSSSGHVHAASGVVVGGVDTACPLDALLRMASQTNFERRLQQQHDSSNSLGYTSDGKIVVQSKKLL